MKNLNIHRCFLFSFFIIFIFFAITLKAEDTLKPFVKIIPTTPDQKAMGCKEYAVYFENFPKNQDIHIFFTRLIKKDSGSYRKCEQLQIDDDGMILINHAKYKSYCLSSTGLAYGEEIKYRFELGDGTLLAEAAYIPRPIHATSKDGSFSLEAILSSAEPTSYSITLKNLNKNEVIHFYSKSGNEEIAYDTKHNSNDAFLYIPGVIGKSGGYSIVKITRKTGDLISCRLPWGLAILAPLMKECQLEEIDLRSVQQ